MYASSLGGIEPNGEFAMSRIRFGASPSYGVVNATEGVFSKFSCL
jgi:hypothetical protein